MTSLISCIDQIDERPKFDPFEINYNVTEKRLIENGYTVIPEDVPILGKQKGDTLIYYQLDYEFDSITKKCINEKVSYRFCYIYLKQVDTLILKHLIANYDADIISEFSHNDEIYLDLTDFDSVSNTTLDFHGSFFVKHRFSKQIFQCYIGKANGTLNGKTEGFELSILNEFP